MKVRPINPCQPTQALARPIFSYLGNPRSLQMPLHRAGVPIWGIPTHISGTWIHSDCSLHISCLELKVVILARHHWVTVLRCQQIATDNTTLLSYINKQGGTHSHILLCLVVDFFLWLRAQDMAIRARHIPGCLKVIADCLSRPA